MLHNRTLFLPANLTIFVLKLPKFSHKKAGIQIVVLEEPRLTGVQSSKRARTAERPLQSGQAYAMEDMADRMSEYTVDETGERTGTGAESGADHMVIVWIILGAAGIGIGCWTWKQISVSRGNR